MSNQSQPQPEEATFDTAKLYPELTTEEQREAAYFLGLYLDTVCRIYERINNLTEEE